MRFRPNVLEAVDARSRRRAIDPFMPVNLHPQMRGSPAMAMDQNEQSVSAWAFGNLNQLVSAFAEGQMFLGFPTLEAMAQRAVTMRVLDLDGREVIPSQGQRQMIAVGPTGRRGDSAAVFGLAAMVKIKRNANDTQFGYCENYSRWMRRGTRFPSAERQGRTFRG
jgi:hypothetical protein